VPYYSLQAGLQTELGTLLPPGGQVVAYVRSGGPVDGDSPSIQARLYTTLNKALALCRSGRGDIVVVLPGHSESISAADQMSNLKAGTIILGCGHGSLRPTFTWTAAASTFLLDVANVRLHNLNLNLEPGTGTVTVAAPITVSAAGCGIFGCRILFGTDANNKVTIGITTTAAATDFQFVGNRCFGATAAECTTFMRLVGNVRPVLINNVIVGASSAAAVGLIQFLTTLSSDVMIDGLHIRNNKASSSQAITGMAGITGYANNLFMGVLANTATDLTGAFGTPASMMFGRQCSVANTIAERAALFGTESA
jgi:hypothetical protein